MTRGQLSQPLRGTCRWSWKFLWIARGTWYISEGTEFVYTSGNRVLRVDAATGSFTLAAGRGFYTGLFSGGGGTAVAADLWQPDGLALAGNLCIVDSGNDRIRRVGFVNLKPAAHAGGDMWVEFSSPAGVIVTLDGSASTDPDSSPGTRGDIASFEWFEDFGLPSESFLGAGQVPETVLQQGVHAVSDLHAEVERAPPNGLRMIRRQ